MSHSLLYAVIPFNNSEWLLRQVQRVIQEQFVEDTTKMFFHKSFCLALNTYDCFLQFEYLALAALDCKAKGEARRQ